MVFDVFSRDGYLDDWNEFVPDHLPAPGPHLDGHDVLADEAHLALHREVRDVFELRGVYDAAYGYNLARLNLDRRFPDAGLRYATEATDDEVLRVEFTPTTDVCPETASLAPAILRALTAEDVPGYERVRVRVAPRYQLDGRLNQALARLERVAHRRGSLPRPDQLDDLDLPELDPDETVGP